MDVIRAYHFGSDFLVEIEIVLDENTILRESHDLALALQIKIEEMERVSRACVCVRYLGQRRVGIHPVLYTVFYMRMFILISSFILLLFSQVERAFVHVDYELRDGPEHKHERMMVAKLDREHSRKVRTRKRRRLPTHPPTHYV